MDTLMKPVQDGRGRRRQWSSEQKLTVLQEWQVKHCFMASRRSACVVGRGLVAD